MSLTKWLVTPLFSMSVMLAEMLMSSGSCSKLLRRPQMEVPVTALVCAGGHWLHPSLHPCSCQACLLALHVWT